MRNGCRVPTRTYQDPSGQRSPTLTQDGGTRTINYARTTRDLTGELVAGDPVFDLLLGTGQPYALTIQAAAIQSDAELGGLPITRLVINQKAGRSRLNLGQANPQSADSLQVSSQGAAFEAWNLANANAAAISLKGDAASYRVDFGGALQRSTHVQISTRASSVEITVPSSTAARISSASLLSELDVGDGFSQQENAFWTPAAAAADRPLLTIDASVEVGQLKLRLREEERSDPATTMKGGHAATADTHRRHGGAAAALITLVEGAAGVHSVQLVQTGPDTLAVRLDTAPDHDHATVWKEVQARLQDHLCRHALESVELIHDPPPRGATPQRQLGQVIVASEARGG